MSPSSDVTIASLRESLCSEDTHLPVRFRALFSLKHLAKHSEGPKALEAIDAIAAALSSPSALLKHELAYCLGQTGNLAAATSLRETLEDLQEDPMVRHEAAEALGALGDQESLDLLRRFRDREGESVAVKETCEIAIDRIEWENSAERKAEKLKQRSVYGGFATLQVIFPVFSSSLLLLYFPPPAVLLRES
jgi:deoxyhypusine monooxygenase